MPQESTAATDRRKTSTGSKKRLEPSLFTDIVTPQSWRGAVRMLGVSQGLSLTNLAKVVIPTLQAGFSLPISDTEAALARMVIMVYDTFVKSTDGAIAKTEVDALQSQVALLKGRIGSLETELSERAQKLEQLEQENQEISRRSLPAIQTEGEVNLLKLREAAQETKYGALLEGYKRLLSQKNLPLHDYQSPFSAPLSELNLLSKRLENEISKFYLFDQIRPSVLTGKCKTAMNAVNDRFRALRDVMVRLNDDNQQMTTELRRRDEEIAELRLKIQSFDSSRLDDSVRRYQTLLQEYSDKHALLENYLHQLKVDFFAYKEMVQLESEDRTARAAPFDVPS